MFSEIKVKLLSLLQNDPALTSLLASESAIYQERPAKGRELPCLTYSLADAPDLSCDGRGKFRLKLRIGIWSTSPDRNESILAALDDALFDRQRTGELDTAHWEVKSCRRIASEPGREEGFDPESGDAIEHLSTEWLLIAFKKSA